MALSKKITDKPLFLYASSLDAEGHLKELERGEIPQKIWGMVTTDFNPSFALPGKQLITVGTPMPFREGADWKKWADKVFEATEEIFPGISEHIIYKYVIGPDYLQSWADEDGVGFPVAQTNQQVGANRPSMIAPINGLFYVGHDVGKGGIGVDLAAESALRCAEIIGNILGPA